VVVGKVGVVLFVFFTRVDYSRGDVVVEEHSRAEGWFGLFVVLKYLTNDFAVLGDFLSGGLGILVFL